MKKVSICICLIILPLVFLSGCESAFNPRFSLEREINLESNFPLGADLKIEVQGKNGNILLLPAADDQFKITMNMHVKASSKEEAEKIADAGIKLEQSAEGILLVIDESKINAGIKLELPPLYRFNLALGNLGGGIEIRDLFCGEINLKNKNGPLILTNIMKCQNQPFNLLSIRDVRQE